MAKGFSGIVRSTVSIFCIGYGFYIIAGIIVNCRANEIAQGIKEELKADKQMEWVANKYYTRV